MLGYRIDEAARIAASEGSDSIILPDRLSDGTRIILEAAGAERLDFFLY